MAKCERGYLCDVCGGEVEALTDSDLYLRYVMGDVPAAQLHVSPERHIRCNPATAQFIRHPDFAPVSCQGPFAMQSLDPAWVEGQEEWVTRAWSRLQELPHLGIPFTEYPLSQAGRVPSQLDQHGP